MQQGGVSLEEVKALLEAYPEGLMEKDKVLSHPSHWPCTLAPFWCTCVASMAIFLSRAFPPTSCFPVAG